METGMMKVVFSSIINGKHGDLQTNGTHAEQRCKTAFKPEIKYGKAKAEKDEFADKTSHEVFTSLVNASNCANLQNEKALDGYLTITAEGAFLREFFSK
jgi:hypothetical protein